MSEKKINYKKASTYYLIGNIFNKGMSFLTVPIFTRLLSTYDYGIVTTYNSWISILSMVMGFAIYMGIRASFVDYSDDTDTILSTATTFTLICGTTMSGIIFLGLFFIRINVSMLLIVLCLLQGMSSALIQNYSMFLMMKYRYKFRTAIMILPNLISAILSIVAIMFVVRTNMYMGRIVPTALVTFCFGLLTVVLVYKGSKVFRLDYLKYMLSISAPLVIHGIALQILSQSDRTMITCLADASQTGIYSLIYNFSMISVVITTALDGVWVPWFTARLKNYEYQKINQKCHMYIWLMTLPIIGVIILGPEVVKILASERYWDGILIIPPVVFSNYIIFAYTLYVNIEHFHKKTIYITVNTLVAASVNIILNYILIPHYGYVAAAYTTLVSYIIALIFHAIYAKKLEPSLYPLSFFLLPILAIVLAIVLFYVLIDMWIVRWGIMMALLLFVSIRERKNIVSIIKCK